MCSKAVLLLLAFMCLASAKHKALNKINFCDLFPIKKPHVVTNNPSSTTPSPTVAYVGPLESGQVTAIPEYSSLPLVSTQQEVQHSAQEPELLNPQQEYEYTQDQGVQYPQQQELQYPPYPPYQVMQYPPQQMVQYSPQQVMPYAPQQVVQQAQQGLQYEIQQDVKYPQPQPVVPSQQHESQYQYPQDVKYPQPQSEVPSQQQESQYQYPQYPISQQQDVQPPKQESQYQSQQEIKGQKLFEEVQSPQLLQYHQQQQAAKPSQYGLEYRPPQQVQNHSTHEIRLPQLALMFPPPQGNPPPYYQSPLTGYESAELSYYQQQMRPNKKLIGYFDNQNKFHNLLPHYAARPHPDSSQYFYSYPLNFLPSASAQIFPQQIVKST